jgi:alpha-beta hydrolase superfamily lysophospholipase
VSPTPTTAISPAADDPSAVDLCLRSTDARVVTFEASDGVPLVGAVLGRGTKGVLLAHQGDATLCDWLPFGETLARRGYLVLAFDHRGFGASGLGPDTTYDLDAVAAAEELRRHGATTMVLIGASLGALAVMTAAPQLDPQPDGVISLSGADEFGGVDALTAVRDLTSPLLLIAAKTDLRFERAARRLARASGSPDTTLRILPGFDHGTALLRFDQAKRTKDLIFDFLRRRLNR